MNLCAGCGKQYKVIQTGVVVNFGTHCKSGDISECPSCGNKLVTGLGDAYREPFAGDLAAYTFNPETMNNPNRTMRLNALEGSEALQVVIDSGIVDPGSEFSKQLQKGLEALKWLSDK